MSRRQFLVGMPNTGSLKENCCILLSFAFYPEGSEWVGDCDELGICTYADTLDNARTSLLSLVQTTMDIYMENSSLKSFLNRNNIPVLPANTMQKLFKDEDSSRKERHYEFHLQPAVI